MEMFLAAVVHVFVFPHSEYSPQAVEARTRALNRPKSLSKRRRTYYWQTQPLDGSGHDSSGRGRPKRLLGRSYWHPYYYGLRDDVSKTSSAGQDGTGVGVELVSYDDSNTVDSWEETPMVSVQHTQPQRSRANSRESIGDRTPEAVMPEFPSFDEEDRKEAANRMKRALSTVEDNDDEDGSEKGDVSQLGSPKRDEEYDEERGDDSGSYSGYDDEEDGDDYLQDEEAANTVNNKDSPKKPGLFRALLDSAIPVDLKDNTVGIVKGDFHVKPQTLLHHASTSDQYDLFNRNQQRPLYKKKQGSIDPKGKTVGIVKGD
jgi:hypothetical protein